LRLSLVVLVAVCCTGGAPWMQSEPLKSTCIPDLAPLPCEAAPPHVVLTPVPPYGAGNGETLMFCCSCDCWLG
jgi:hypothetical protein